MNKVIRIRYQQRYEKHRPLAHHTDSFVLFKDQLVSKKATFSYLFIKMSQSV